MDFNSLFSDKVLEMAEIEKQRQLDLEFKIIERVLYKLTWEENQKRAGIYGDRLMGRNLRNELVLVDDVVYKVCTDPYTRINFITAVTESEDLDTEERYYIKFKYGIKAEELDCIEYPRLLNINDVEGMYFKEFLKQYKGNF